MLDIKGIIEQFNNNKKDVNFISSINPDENAHTKILIDFFNSNKQCLIKSFINEFFKGKGITEQEENKCRAIFNKDYIDGLIEYGDYRIIIENKVKWADDQLRQLERYVGKIFCNDDKYLSNISEKETNKILDKFPIEKNYIKGIQDNIKHKKDNYINETDLNWIISFLEKKDNKDEETMKRLKDIKKERNNYEQNLKKAIDEKIKGMVKFSKSNIDRNNIFVLYLVPDEMKEPNIYSYTTATKFFLNGYDENNSRFIKIIYYKIINWMEKCRRRKKLTKNCRKSIGLYAEYMKRELEGLKSYNKIFKSNEIKNLLIFRDRLKIINIFAEHLQSKFNEFDQFKSFQKEVDDNSQYIQIYKPSWKNDYIYIHFEIQCVINFDKETKQNINIGLQKESKYILYIHVKLRKHFTDEKKFKKKLELHIKRRSEKEHMIFKEQTEEYWFEDEIVKQKDNKLIEEIYNKFNPWIDKIDKAIEFVPEDKRKTNNNLKINIFAEQVQNKFNELDRFKTFQKEVDQKKAQYVQIYRPSWKNDCIDIHFEIQYKPNENKRIKNINIGLQKKSKYLLLIHIKKKIKTFDEEKEFINKLLNGNNRFSLSKHEDDIYKKLSKSELNQTKEYCFINEGKQLIEEIYSIFEGCIEKIDEAIKLVPTINDIVISEFQKIKNIELREYIFKCVEKYIMQKGKDDLDIFKENIKNILYENSEFSNIEIKGEINDNFIQIYKKHWKNNNFADIHLEICHGEWDIEYLYKGTNNFSISLDIENIQDLNNVKILINKLKDKIKDKYPTLKNVIEKKEIEKKNNNKSISIEIEKNIKLDEYFYKNSNIIKLNIITEKIKDLITYLDEITK